jgi:hypothetical protein
MPLPPRKKAEDALLLALACGATVEVASRQCGLSERTIYRRLKEQDFKRKLRDVRADMLARTSAALSAAATEAVRTLLDLQKSGVQAAVRLGAARAILEIGLKLRETVDLEARIAALEDRQAPMAPSLPAPPAAAA